jgi:hypothetical protein
MTRDERERALLVLALHQIEALCDFRVAATGAEIDRLLAAIDAVASLALKDAGAVALVS